MQELKLEEKEIKEGAPFAALSYFLFLWIFTFIFCPHNRFAYYHAKQGIVIFIGEVSFMFLALLPLVGRIFYVVGLLLFLFLSLAGIISSLSGRLIKFPLITKLTQRFVI